MQLALHPKQSQVFQSRARQILFGGSAGPGKSHLLRVAGIAWATGIAGLQVYLFRRTFPDLYKNHMEGPTAFPQLLAPWIAEGYVKVHYDKNQLAFANGSRIHLTHMQHEQDVQKIHGAEIHVALIDELTHFSKPQYAFIRSRVRMAGIEVPEAFTGCFPRILAASNPGSIGHNWVRALFIDPAPPGEIWDAPPEEGGLTTQFIPAFLHDNPSLMQEDPDYANRLRGLGSPELVKAMLEGDWHVLAGGYFDDLWDPKVHIVEPVPIPPQWKIRRAFDWGSSKPFSCGWYAHSDGATPAPDGRRYPKGTRFRIMENYGWNGKPNEGLRLTNTEIARRIKEVEDASPYKGRIQPGPADRQIFDVVNGRSIAAEMETMGIRWEVAQKGPGSRRQGWQLIRQLLKASTEYPMEAPGLFVFSTCRQFIRTFPVLPRDPANQDDVDCFIAGTLIDTPYGQVPVEELVPGDYVHTPIGPRRILKAGVSGIVPTCSITCADKTTLEGTFDHKIYVKGRGLLPLCMVSLGDILLKREELWTFEQSHMQVSSFDSTRNDDILSVALARRNVLDQASYIVLSGYTNVAKSLTAMMSTTKTMMSPLTTLKTWNSGLRVSMGDTISKNALRPVAISLQLLQHGGNLRQGKRLFETMLRGCSQILPSENLRALIVASLFERSTLAKNIVLRNAVLPLGVEEQSQSYALSVVQPRLSSHIRANRHKPVVISVAGSSVNKKVYYLTVDQAHLFYANGVLSANSDSEDHIGDELRYECTMPFHEARTLELSF